MKVIYNISEVVNMLAEKHNATGAEVEIIGLPIPTTSAFPEELRKVVRMIRENNKIAAIKHLRSYVFPNYGLRESKELVEFLAYDAMQMPPPEWWNKNS